MAVSDGKITAPVSIQDIKSATGNSNNDLGSLCKQEAINKWSIRKPLKSFKMPFDAEFRAHEGRQQTSTVTADAWYTGANCFGISKKSMSMGGLTPGGQGSKTAAPIAFQLYVEDETGDLSWEAPTGGENYPYRISDFIGYVHSASNKYPVCGSKPFYVFNIYINTADTFLASCNIRYDFEDIILGTTTVNGVTINEGLLGLKSLYNADQGNNDTVKGIRLGIAITADYSTNQVHPKGSTKRTTPLTVIAIGGTKLGDADPTTGESIIGSVTTGTIGNLIGGTASSPASDKFYVNENVYIQPLIAKKGANVWTLFGIGKGRWAVIGEGRGTFTYVNPSSISMTITILHNQTDGSYTAYIKDVSHLAIVIAVPGGTSRFYMTNQLSMSTKGSDYNIQKYTPAVIGTNVTGTSDFYIQYTTAGTKTLNASTMVNWSTTTTPESRGLSCKFTTKKNSVVLSASMSCRKTNSDGTFSVVYWKGSTSAITLPTGANETTTTLSLSS